MGIAPPAEVEEFLRRVLGRGYDLWLIGSQANKTAKPDSDWDFFIFGSVEFLDELESEEPIPGLDPLVVYDGDSFRSPWPRSRDGAAKSGSLRCWKWRRLSAEKARYRGEHWDDQLQDWGWELAFRIHAEWVHTSSA